MQKVIFGQDVINGIVAVPNWHNGCAEGFYFGQWWTIQGDAVSYPPYPKHFTSRSDFLEPWKQEWITISRQNYQGEYLSPDERGTRGGYSYTQQILSSYWVIGTITVFDRWYGDKTIEVVMSIYPSGYTYLQEVDESGNIKDHGKMVKLDDLGKTYEWVEIWHDSCHIPTENEWAIMDSYFEEDKLIVEDYWGLVSKYDFDRIIDDMKSPGSKNRKFFLSVIDGEVEKSRLHYGEEECQWLRMTINQMKGHQISRVIRRQRDEFAKVGLEMCDKINNRKRQLTIDDIVDWLDDWWYID